MKKFSLLLILSLFLFQVHGQEETNLSLKPNGWEIGWITNDIFIGRLTADVILSYSNKHAFGLRSSIGNDFFNSSFGGLYEGTNFEYRGGLFHKMYFPQKRNRQLTIRHGLRVKYSENYYEKDEWMSFENLGNTQYVLRNATKTDRNFKLGYELILGLQQRYESKFFYEYYAGITYMQLVSTTSNNFGIDELSEYNVLSDFFEFTSDRMAIVVGVVIGLQWDN
jgi:hypothetical protein